MFNLPETLRIYRFVPLVVCISFILTACSTNTIFDALIYPTEYYYVPIPSDPNGLVICKSLEQQGYQLDEFSIYDIGLEITYPDGIKRRFRQAREVNVIVVIDIERNYDNPNIFSDAEYTRIEGLARAFFKDFQQIVTEKQLSLSVSGVFYWDYNDGVRGGFRFSPDGKITSSYGWSTGSYANLYEFNKYPSCPSGRVI